MICKSFTKIWYFSIGQQYLWEKLVSSSELPIIFDDNLKTTLDSFFIADLSWEFDSFTFIVSFYTDKD